MSAHIELPLPYRVRCKPFRSRHESSVELLDFTTVPVHEISGYEAPLAVEITDGHAVEEMRWFEGSYWIADKAQDPACGNVRNILKYSHHDPEVLGTESLFLYTYYRNNLENFHQRTRKTVESERCREVTHSDRDASLARLEQRVARECVMIDGVLHMAVQEPFRIIELDRSLHATVRFGKPHWDWSRQKLFAFSIDRVDDFTAVLDAAAANDGLSPYIALQATYHCGETTPVTGREDADLVSVAKEWLRSDDHKIREWPKERGMAWFDLRDAYAEIEDKESRDDAKLDRVADALRSYGEVIDIGPFARVVLERWQFRPIQMEPEADGDAATPGL